MIQKLKIWVIIITFGSPAGSNYEHHTIDTSVNFFETSRCPRVENIKAFSVYWFLGCSTKMWLLGSFHGEIRYQYFSTIFCYDLSQLKIYDCVIKSRIDSKNIDMNNPPWPLFCIEEYFFHENNLCFVISLIRKRLKRLEINRFLQYEKRPNCLKTLSQFEIRPNLKEIKIKHQNQINPRKQR